MNKTTRWLYIISLVTAGIVIALYYQQIPLLEGTEQRTWDSRLRIAQSTRKPDPRIAIIAIDEKSIAAIGRFPWSRDVYARFIDAMRKAGARAVLLDVLFTEPETAAHDKQLARAIKEHGRVSLAEFVEFDADGAPQLLRQSIPQLQQSTFGSGHINLFPDEDGVVRWGTLLMPFNGSLRHALSVQGASEALGGAAVSAFPYGVKIGERLIPTDQQHRMLINYAASSAEFDTYSFSDILAGKVPADRLKNRIFFVGATAVGIYDMRVTPISGNTPGVILTAIVADSILNDHHLKRRGTETLIDLAAIILISFFTAGVLLRKRHTVALVLLAVLAASYPAICYAALALGSRISMFYPLTAMALAFTAAAFARFGLLDRKAREIRSLFAQFVSAKVVDRLVKNPELACVSGEKRVVTILFADIKNYTSFSEQRDPREIVKVLNLYLSEMVSIIMEFDGTLDKFMGDGILAYWNAPLEQPAHAELAVRCALEMIKQGGAVQKKIADECGETLSWGIGINTGEVVAGIIGAADKKMEYTIIGDNVNTTYRIQNLSRDTECPVITRSLYDLVQEMVHVDRLEPVLVKGKKNPLEVFALKGLKQ